MPNYKSSSLIIWSKNDVDELYRTAQNEMSKNFEYNENGYTLEIEIS